MNFKAASIVATSLAAVGGALGAAFLWKRHKEETAQPPTFESVRDDLKQMILGKIDRIKDIQTLDAADQVPVNEAIVPMLKERLEQALLVEIKPDGLKELRKVLDHANAILLGMGVTQSLKKTYATLDKQQREAV